MITLISLTCVCTLNLLAHGQQTVIANGIFTRAQHGIDFNGNGQIFHLYSAASSYIFHIDQHGLPQHLHWGDRIDPRDVNAVRDLMSPEVENSFDAGPKNSRLLEYADGGTGDFRVPSFKLHFTGDAHESFLSPLTYRGHEIMRGKPHADASIPHIRSHNSGDAKTLRLDLIDAVRNVELSLFYTVYANSNILTRSVRIQNHGEGAVDIERLMSVSVDMPASTGERRWHVTHFAGSWSRERQLVTHPVSPGLFGFESRRGASSHQHHPFLILSQGPLNEESGGHYAVGLVYPSSFYAQIEHTQSGSLRTVMGLHPDQFRWRLNPHESFTTPESVLAYSAEGMGAISRDLHRLIRHRVLPPRASSFRPKPVLVNSWETFYFNPTAETMLERLVKPAKALGMNLVVLDDGWFRDNDASGLGDWKIDLQKFPQGLAGFVAQARLVGVDVGIWIEPEMVSPGTELLDKHPDWALQSPGRAKTLGRQQLVLDLSRRDVQDYLIDVMSGILRLGWRYVKWDFNRHLTEVESALLNGRQGETMHRWVLGLYRIMGELTAAFPDILFESCSGGGGRFDLSMLYFMPQVWTRIKIQYATSMLYPPLTMGAHVAAVPNHQTQRWTPWWTRHAVALSGILGYEMDLSTLSEDEKRVATDVISTLWPRVESILRTGDLYRLSSPFTPPMHLGSEQLAASWMVVTPNRKEAVLFVYLSSRFEPVLSTARVQCRGLDPQLAYRVEWWQQRGDPRSANVAKQTLTMHGRTLMASGIRLAMQFDLDSAVILITAQ